MKYLIQFIVIPVLYIPIEYFLEGDLDNYSVFENLLFAFILTFGTYCQDVYRKDNEEIGTN